MRSLRTSPLVYLLGGVTVLVLAGFGLRATIAARLQSEFAQVAFQFRSILVPEFGAAGRLKGSLSRRSSASDPSDETRGGSLPSTSPPATTPSVRDLRLPDGHPGPRVQIDVVPPLDPRNDAAETRSAPVAAPAGSTLQAATFGRQQPDAVVRPLEQVGAGSGAGSGAGRIPALRVRLFIEYDATHDEAGIQAVFDEEAWKRVRIFGPAGRPVFEITAQQGLTQVDLTEPPSEGEEPSLAQIFQKFPPGKYAFEGTTVEGDELKGAATLSYNLPDPAVIFPVESNNPVIAWTWMPSPRSPIQELAGFQVIVEDGLGASMTVDLSPSMTSLEVPPEFLKAGTKYTFEVAAIAANGNRTISEGSFVMP